MRTILGFLGSVFSNIIANLVVAGLVATGLFLWLRDHAADKITVRLWELVAAGALVLAMVGLIIWLATTRQRGTPASMGAQGPAPTPAPAARPTNRHQPLIDALGDVIQAFDEGDPALGADWGVAEQYNDILAQAGAAEQRIRLTALRPASPNSNGAPGLADESNADLKARARRLRNELTGYGAPRQT